MSNQLAPQQLQQASWPPLEQLPRRKKENPERSEGNPVRAGTADETDGDRRAPSAWQRNGRGGPRRSCDDRVRAGAFGCPSSGRHVRALCGAMGTASNHRAATPGVVALFLAGAV